MNSTEFAQIIGSGVALAVITFPVTYYPLARACKTTLSNRTVATLFSLAVPLNGISALIVENYVGATTPAFFIQLLACFCIALVFLTAGFEFNAKCDRRIMPTRSDIRGSLIEGQVSAEDKSKTINKDTLSDPIITTDIVSFLRAHRPIEVYIAGAIVFFLLFLDPTALTDRYIDLTDILSIRNSIVFGFIRGTFDMRNGQMHLMYWILATAYLTIIVVEAHRISRWIFDHPRR